MRVKNDIRQMLDMFDQSPAYNDLTNQLDILSARFGVPYLNSVQCRALLQRKHLLEEMILKRVNHETLFKIYKGWLDIHDRRENEMIKNIYSYSNLNKYNRALFLMEQSTDNQ